jgi:hypothetical protein
MGSYIARLFVASTTRAEIIGQSMVNVIEALELDGLHPILVKHDLRMIDTEVWYPYQLWLDVLADIWKNLGNSAPTIFMSLGRNISQGLPLEDAPQTLPDALMTLHNLHRAGLRNIAEDEGYFVEVMTPKHYMIYHNTPNPPDVIYGFLWGWVTRFKKPHETFVVRLVGEDTTGRGNVVYEVKWGAQ